MTHPVDAIHDALIAKGCQSMCNEISFDGEGIWPPNRRLTPWEAVAMCAAWRDGYAAMGAPLCNHLWSRVGEQCNCPEGSVPNMANEEIAAHWANRWIYGEHVRIAGYPRSEDHDE